MQRKLLACFLVLFPIIAYFSYLFCFAVNLPNTDDLPAIFDFIGQFYPFKSEKWPALFVPFREHVVVLAKIAAYVQLLLQGTLNLKILILLGNLFWVGVAYRLYTIFRQTKLPLIYFLPVTLILFQFQFAETAFWTMALWSNVAVLWLLGESLHLLVDSNNKHKPQFRWALLLAVLAVFTNGNGVLILPMGLVILWLKKENIQKMAVWLLVSVATVYFYLQCRQNINSDYGIASNLKVILLGVFAFTGSYADVVSGSFRWLAAPVGLLIVVGSGWVGIKNYSKRTFLPAHLFKLLAFLGFILATAAATTLLRTGFNGLDALFLGRYRHYSALALAIFYLVLLGGITWQPQKAKMILVAFSAFALVASALSYYRDWGYRYFQQQELTADTYNMRFNNRLYLHRQQPQPLENYFRQVADAHIFAGEPYKILQKPVALTSPIPIKMNWEIAKNQSLDLCNEVIEVEAEAVEYPLKNGHQSFWVLSNTKNSYLFSGTATKASPKQFILNGTYFKKGLKGEIPLCQIVKQGEYRLYLLHTNNQAGGQLYVSTDFKLRF
ncbi:MAG: hypothetical protein EAZ70_06420 [Runella slithyformis]|nr:MAG: hypothetical protein EAY79_04050 [Runella slithyformis]TAF27698.1 MAG: hypothetical protein EAZ70_06420 [Runella slithyformis]TAF44624.1 MAG: hypothetical protein EAZ63_12120 [Runella slithyformis]TAF80170.1 MAG: hypothetical protein EAZ50_09460 [Runella slithyformis]